ncbi:septal ring lytic transglycosylase RlpA family lipoprotein [Leptospira perolatii]|uniref:Probable endolytic peptidoglycan transglycosylase RlpA n=1 Tax=Leptospira perolatii TaxID=2023191 RepID=A0A2M9ZR59_9LEPT|nr:septal ring lytic transglycosylase RlpA family protein [Leptospira perolatii]PJZ71036.1 septal ring lytic transglycosylase RlpA family lipoprotein [Leptospira perolatii]PJZ74568.1 septal ring lytic transglycosylase RlpA family lipoprotein [Leptospira perolatii]
MNRFSAIIALTAITACASAEPRQTVSASGDPSEIFFEKEIESMDQESKQDLRLAKSGNSKNRSLEEDLSPNKMVKATTPAQRGGSGDFDEVGYSSWYGAKFHGKPTASGEIFDKNKLTAAHPSLPLGSVIKVKNLENDKEILVKVNDRGPFAKDRILDLSEKAAESLEFKDVGIARVGLKVMRKGGGGDESEDLEGLEDEESLLEDSKPEKLVPKRPIVPAPLVKGAPKGYSVQVGVFRNNQLAENYRKNLSAEYGEKVYLFEREGMFVLQMGDFSDRPKAEILKGKLKEEGVDCFIPRK